MVGWEVKHELERIWKLAVWPEILPQHLLAGTEEEYENRQPRQSVLRKRLEHRRLPSTSWGHAVA
jgi:hypothetical protein